MDRDLSRTQKISEWILGLRDKMPEPQSSHIEPPEGFEEGHDFNDEDCKLIKTCYKKKLKRS